ncbi:hypothetical protein [Gandjariella thermophila]|uniref:Right handed beta helix domain-containing protein n=1 Tax=Gandjariella thermophila TaxID=1931992 RepID=A0A4D4JGM2_9PSEU|nr:hypothetical protein [Gandjariella thermophila]GDY33556.1 hypothetical protein GTS_51890 [Gandjariella thermophila]
MPANLSRYLATIVAMAGTAMLLTAAQAPSDRSGKVIACGDVTALVAAIQKANSGGSGTIRVAPQCTYTLTVPQVPQVPRSSAGADGLPVITATVIIIGYRTIIARSARAVPFRLFEIAPTGRLALGGVTVSGGDLPHGVSPSPDGAGILNNGGKLGIFRGSAVLHNRTAGSGGGIANRHGEILLDHARVMGNIAGTNGGGIDNEEGIVTVTDQSVLDGNVAAIDGGGICTRAGTVTVAGSEVTFNTPNNCSPRGAVPNCLN